MAASEAVRPFVHLRVHSAYSLLEGALTVPKLAELTTACEMPALALTDRNNLFGALEFSETLAKVGVQPIIGCTLSIDFDDIAQKNSKIIGKGEDAGPSEDSGGFLALLAKDETGYANLLRLSSKAFLDHAGATEPFVTLDDLIDANAGLIALTGGPEGPVDQALQAGNEDLAGQRLEKLVAAFGDRLYVELQRHSVDEEKTVEPSLLALAYRLQVPLVATNQPYFATQY